MEPLDAVPRNDALPSAVDDDCEEQEPCPLRGGRGLCDIGHPSFATVAC